MATGVRDGYPVGDGGVAWACAANHLTVLAASRHASVPTPRMGPSTNTTTNARMWSCQPHGQCRPRIRPRMHECGRASPTAGAQRHGRTRRMPARAPDGRPRPGGTRYASRILASSRPRIVPAPRPVRDKHGRTRRMPDRAPEGRATPRVLASSHPHVSVRLPCRDCRCR